MRTGSILAAAMLLLASSVAASDGTVAGSFRVGKRAISPKYAAAYRTGDRFNFRKTVTEVVLSQMPFDAAGAVAALDRHKFQLTDPGLRNGGHIVLWIDDDGLVDMNATVAEPMTIYAGSTAERGAMHRELKADLTENKPGHIAGRIYTPVPVKAGSDSFELDVTFSIDVAARAVDSQLAAGGGAPGKALVELLTAMAKSDGATVRKSLSKRIVGKLYDNEYRTDAANLEFAVEMLNGELPRTDVKILGGDLSGDAAILRVEGATGGVRAAYLIRMLKEEGGWTFDEAFVAGYL